MDTISIIVPIYNAEKYLNRCISSIIKQTYTDLEIILVDDGSKDTSGDICDYWQKNDDRIIVVHQENSGVSAARNKGICQSTGKYIMMLDSDDYMATQTVQLLYQAIIKEDAQIAICDFVEGEDDAYYFQINQPPISSVLEVLTAENATRRLYDSSHSALQYGTPWAKLYRASLFDGIQYPVGKIFEDIYITHELLGKCDRIVVCPQKLIYYYNHSDSIMHQEFHLGKLDYLEACANRIKYYKKQGYKELPEIAYDEYLHSLVWEYSRARDLLANKAAMKDIHKRFKEVYRRGYSSKRYEDENPWFLALFNMNPEFVMLFWKIKAKLKTFRK